ncbi:MAG: c-type cytochrome [Synechococcales bacterium]|nr:c-type cytochrome [Cyanobacteria bacterium REEB444]MEB3124925.1 c-type cytochrome [Synechococcales bacterium]
MRKILLIGFVILGLWTGSGHEFTLAAGTTNGSKIFNANCAACHIGGGNIVNRAKTLKWDALQKYKMDSVAAISTQIVNGKNSMPSFRTRLTNEQAENVAKFVLAQAHKGW